MDNQELAVGKSYLTTASVNYDAVYICGGQNSVNTMMNQGDTLHFINEAVKHAKAIGAANEGVDILASSQIRGIIIVTSNDSWVTSEAGVVTMRNASDLTEFCNNYLNAISQHRHWQRENNKDGVPT